MLLHIILHFMRRLCLQMHKYHYQCTNALVHSEPRSCSAQCVARHNMIMQHRMHVCLGLQHEATKVQAHVTALLADVG